MKVKKYFLNVKENLKIPVIEIGSFFGGFGCVVCQLHGDEYSAVKIAYTINDQLTRTKQGKSLGLRIILCANPNGSRLGIKEYPDKSMNLNRMFQKKYFSDKLVSGIIKLITNSSFCIDVHDMPGSDLPACSILTKTQRPEVESLSYDLISAFGPDLYWEEDFSDPTIGQRYAGTINSFLNSVGIPNFTIETSPINLISDKTILSVSKKIIALLTPTKKPVFKPKLVKRIEIASRESGIFLPNDLKLLQSIKRDEPVGKLLNLTGRIKQIYSPSSGLLIRLASRGFIKEKQKLFDLGKRL